MTQLLYHISEEKGIAIFPPRVSKEQWGRRRLVWAISKEKLGNYLLPRLCPRICLELEQDNNYLDVTVENGKRRLVFVPEDWRKEIDRCILYQYEFSDSNFEIIDPIAGYYVSSLEEKPLKETRIVSCSEKLKELGFELRVTSNERFAEIREYVVGNLESFSIIKWSNFENGLTPANT